MSHQFSIFLLSLATEISFFDIDNNPFKTSNCSSVGVSNPIHMPERSTFFCSFCFQVLDFESCYILSIYDFTTPLPSPLPRHANYITTLIDRKHIRNHNHTASPVSTRYPPHQFIHSQPHPIQQSFIDISAEILAAPLHTSKITIKESYP